MKDEYSLECITCGLYNLQDGIIDKGNIYCKDCYLKLEEKRKMWRLSKKYNKVKVPIKFKKKDGGVVVIIGTKLILKKKGASKIKTKSVKKK